MAGTEGRSEEGSSHSAAAGGSANTAQDGFNSEADSSSKGELVMCRICFRGSLAGSLLSPCKCRGTIGLVHKECLEEWLSRRDTDECSICSYQFKVERTPKSIVDWLRDPGSRVDRWYIVVDISLSLFGAAVLLLSTWLSAVEIISGISSLLGSVIIGITVVLEGVVCVADIFLMMRHHHEALIHWRQNNWAVCLLLSNTTPEGAMSAGVRGAPTEPPLS